VDVRIISATNKNLKHEVSQGRFREDLFYRLNVIPIHLPPLRERQNDIPLLAAHFLAEAEQESGNKVPDLAPETLDSLMDYRWPGNVRELKNAIQFSVVRSRGNKILPADLPVDIAGEARNLLDTQATPDPSPAEIPLTRGKLTIESIKIALTKTGGNKSKAARVLGVGRATLYRFLAQHESIKAYADRL
jgi:sigma-54 dependent transcriptional regulator, acetoin dehydrogenase operon transcriptional activator AcoR